MATDVRINVTSPDQHQQRNKIDYSGSWVLIFQDGFWLLVPFQFGEMTKTQVYFIPWILFMLLAIAHQYTIQSIVQLSLKCSFLFAVVVHASSQMELEYMYD